MGDVPVFDVVPDRQPRLPCRKSGIVAAIPAHRCALRIAIEAIAGHKEFEGITYPLARDLASECILFGSST